MTDNILHLQWAQYHFSQFGIYIICDEREKKPFENVVRNIFFFFFLSFMLKISVCFLSCRLTLVSVSVFFRFTKCRYTKIQRLNFFFFSFLKIRTSFTSRCNILTFHSHLFRMFNMFFSFNFCSFFLAQLDKMDHVIFFSYSLRFSSFDHLKFPCCIVCTHLKKKLASFTMKHSELNASVKIDESNENEIENTQNANTHLKMKSQM